MAKVVMTKVKSATSVLQASELADARGCLLKTLSTDHQWLYWVENAWFISKPFESLDELILLILKLPLRLQSDPADEHDNTAISIAVATHACHSIEHCLAL